MSFGMEQARALVDAGIRAAEGKGYLVAVTIVDAAGNFMWSGRMDGTKFVAPDIARAKAFTAAAYFGGLDILVNVAGVRVYGALADAEPDSWDSILAVNLMATVHCCRAAIPLLRSRGGSIVNVSSVFGVTGRAGMGQYDVTKAAVVSLSRTLAIEEVGNGIRVNAVCPGPTITPFHIERAKARGVSEEELRRTGAQHTLMKRWAEPREVAHTILFLACDEASFVTGTALVVDGGASAASA